MHITELNFHEPLLLSSQTALLTCNLFKAEVRILSTASSQIGNGNEAVLATPMGCLLLHVNKRVYLAC